MALPRTIRNCRPVIAEPCPRTWEALTDTADPAVRHCESCGKSVFFCATDEETIARAKAGECVAREEPDVGDLGVMVLGRPSVPVVVTAEQMANRARRARERGINRVLGRDPAEFGRACSGCGWPVPGFRETCEVCGVEVGRG